MTHIPGLTVIPAFMSPVEQEILLGEIDAQPWMGQLRRRVQHYGYIYDYKKRTVDPDMYLGSLPGWLEYIAQRLHAPGVFPLEPDQCIINEYEPGQGISPHIDCEPCFGEVIVSISLGSGCVMTFTHVETSVREEVYLPAGSLLLMQGEARHEWKHGIAARKTDKVDGITFHRSRRVSVTFRKVVVKPSLAVALA